MAGRPPPRYAPNRLADGHHLLLTLSWDCDLLSLRFPARPRDLMTPTLRLPDFRFTKTTLPNGLDVIVRRQGDLPVVAVNLWYHVGSKNEGPRQRGYAHLFE